MNIKKKMKKNAAADHQKILDSNKDFLQSLLNKDYPDTESIEQMNDSKPKKTRKQFWSRMPLVAATILFVAAMALLIVFLPKGNSYVDIGGDKPKDGYDIGDNNDDKKGGDSGGFDDEKNYLNENILSKDIEFADINKNLQSLELNLNDYQLKEVQLFYDSLTNDYLFYKVTGNNEECTEEWTIEIEVNGYYKLGHMEDKYVQIHIQNEYTIRYYSQVQEEDGLYFFTTYAFIEFPKEKLYFKYDSIALEEDGNTFFEYLNTIIITK